MVIGAFPVAKLGVLAIKQISKPIANVLKAKAKEHPFFRNYVCMPPAQFYNWMEIKMKMKMLNLGKPVVVPPLNEAMAIELGSNLLGEFIIFAIGAGILIFEYSRQTYNEARKQEKLLHEKAELQTTLAEMGFRLERQDTQLREMTRILADLESRSIFKWGRERIGEYLPFDPNNPDQSVNGSSKTQNESAYNPNDGIVFHALHFLDTNIFVDGRKPRPAKTDDKLRQSRKEVEPLTELSSIEENVLHELPMDEIYEGRNRVKPLEGVNNNK